MDMTIINSDGDAKESVEVESLWYNEDENMPTRKKKGNRVLVTMTHEERVSTVLRIWHPHRKSCSEFKNSGSSNDKNLKSKSKKQKSPSRLSALARDSVSDNEEVGRGERDTVASCPSSPAWSDPVSDEASNTRNGNESAISSEDNDERRTRGKKKGFFSKVRCRIKSSLFGRSRRTYSDPGRLQTIAKTILGQESEGDSISSSCEDFDEQLPAIASVSHEDDSSSQQSQPFSTMELHGRTAVHAESMEYPTTPSPHRSTHSNPLISSAPPGHSTAPTIENNEELSPQEALAIPSLPPPVPVTSKWSSHRIDFASRCTLKRHEDNRSQPPSTTWTLVQAQTFSVRSGPKYNRNKIKKPSLSSLYDVVAVRCFRSKSRTQCIADALPLPPGLDVLSNYDIKDMDVPQLLIVHFQLPCETPNIFFPKTDGAGSEVVYYLQPSERFLNEINGLTEPTSASLLFLEWCKKSTTCSPMRSRFKCMAFVHHLDALNLGWLKPYNAKPVLITESGSIRTGTTHHNTLRYVEMSCNVHKWAFMAKKSFVTLLPRFRDMKIDVGFTIEALADDEMPECILGTVGMNYIDESTLITIPKEMQIPQPS